MLSWPMRSLHRSSITITEGLNRPWMFAELYSQSPPPGSSLLFSFSEVRQRDQTLRQKENSSGKKGTWQCVRAWARESSKWRTGHACPPVYQLNICVQKALPLFRNIQDLKQRIIHNRAVTEMNTNLFPVVATTYTDVDDWNPWYFSVEGMERKRSEG